MEDWYVLSTAKRQEAAAATLLERRLECMFSCLAVPKRAKVFRSGGAWLRLEEVLFPGYLFVKTACREKLAEALLKSRFFPQPVGPKDRPGRGSKGQGRRDAGAAMVPVEEADLAFLQDVCGKDLTEVMGVSRITLGEDGEIVETQGALLPYLDRLVKLNLHKRFAIVELPLFNRTQRVLFGVELLKEEESIG